VFLPISLVMVVVVAVFVELFGSTVR
jgi:hypothetical protein